MARQLYFWRGTLHTQISSIYRPILGEMALLMEQNDLTSCPNVSTENLINDSDLLDKIMLTPVVYQHSRTGNCKMTVES
jgi:hypothetical protein